MIAVPPVETVALPTTEFTCRAAMEGTRFNATRSMTKIGDERCPYFIQIDFSPLTQPFAELRNVSFLKSADCLF